MNERDLRVINEVWLLGAQTADEFCDRDNLYINTWAPVFTRLRATGYLERTGERRATVNGGTAWVVDLTLRGKLAAQAAQKGAVR
jgi:hypothetical protein